MWKEEAVVWYKMLSWYVSLETEKDHEIHQDRRSSCRDAKPGPPQYEAGVLSTRTQCTVKSTFFSNIFFSIAYVLPKIRHLRCHFWYVVPCDISAVGRRHTREPKPEGLSSTCRLSRTAWLTYGTHSYCSQREVVRSTRSLRTHHAVMTRGPLNTDSGNLESSNTRWLCSVIWKGL
jgi:hypothetical protein